MKTKYLHNHICKYRKFYLLLVVLILSPRLFSASVQCKDLDFINQKKLTLSEEGVLFLPVTKEYVDQEESIKAQSLMFLTSAEYRKAVREDSIPVSSILVLDEMPLGVDLPLVAALIVGKELLLEATHTQILAEKTGIPFVYSKGIFENLELRKLRKKASGSFELNCKNLQCSIRVSREVYTPRPQLKSILPLNYDRDVRAIYSFDRDRLYGRAPRELSGDKYFELMGLKFIFPHLVPDIISLASGFFENFINNYSSAGQVLRTKYQQLNQDLEKAHFLNDESQVKQLLSVFRQDILNSEPTLRGYDIFDEIVFSLEGYYNGIFNKNLNTHFAIRSNQEVEDLLAAGLYKSTVARSLTKVELEPNIKKSWASLYDYRAYNIRRYWGQRENNLSTALMIHPFVGPVQAHSLGTFKLDSSQNLELEINMVLGDQEKATNPSDSAKVIQLSILDNPKKGPQIKLKSRLKENTVSSLDQILPKAIEKSMLSFFIEVKKFVRDEFLLRSYVPENINIEFVVQNSEGFLGKSKVMVLQYKPSLNKEVVIDLLNGLLGRMDTDKKLIKNASIVKKEDLLKELSFKSLGPVVLGLYQQFFSQEKRTPYRYALLIENRKPFLVFWSTSVQHALMKMKLSHSKVKWLKSGNVSLVRRVVNSQNPVLIFSETTIENTDSSLTLENSARLFQQAFDDALFENSELHRLLLDQKPEITFNTYEGVNAVFIPN